MFNFASRAVDRQDNDAISSNNSSCSSSQDINELLNIDAFLIIVSVLFSLNKIGLCSESIRFYQE